MQVKLIKYSPSKPKYANRANDTYARGVAGTARARRYLSNESRRWSNFPASGIAASAAAISRDMLLRAYALPVYICLLGACNLVPTADSATSNSCSPACVAGEICRQVYNTNNQFECVANSTGDTQNATAESSMSASGTAINNVTSSSNTPVGSTALAGCLPACSANQLCRQVNQFLSHTVPAQFSHSCHDVQVYNTVNQYECVDTATSTATAPSPSASDNSGGNSRGTRCQPVCSSDEVCRQVYNTNNQYECVASSNVTANAPSPSTIMGSGVCPAGARYLQHNDK